MKYIWTEDTGAGLHYWQLVNHYLFHDEYVILAFQYLIQWTESGRRDKVLIRKYILQAMQGHQINLELISDEKTLNYLMGFKRFSTERVMKSLLYELTDQKKWSVKGERLGECWHKDCCVLEPKEMCTISRMTGQEKIATLLHDIETTRLISVFG